MMDLRMRRTRWLLGGGIGLVALLLFVGVSSRRCSMIVYNETGAALHGLSIAGPGFMWRVETLDGGTSRRRAISPTLETSTFVVHRGLAGDLGQEIWFEAGPGRRLIIRIWPDGTIEADRHQPWWE